MIISNTEALKSWLVIVLAPLCDADSSALARYVLALLKKDKPEYDLKCVMIEQLDVFLGEETTPFVERLFNAINNEEYLSVPALPHATAQSTTSPAVKLENEFDIEENISVEPIILPTSNIEIASKTDNLKIPDKKSASEEKLKPLTKDECNTKEVNHHKAVGSDVSAYNHQCKSSNSTAESGQRHISPLRGSGPTTTADKENQPRESRRRRASQHSRSRTRSRSGERYTRRSRSPRDRRGSQRQFRNKSPPSSSHDRRRGVFTRSERQRSSGASNNASNVNNAENARRNRSNPHSKSPSPDRRSNANTGTQASTGLQHMASAMSHVAGQGVEKGNSEKRQRCRDFDEKGYCVRGETCPWDHGINPVVFEGINNPALISMSLREYNPDAPDLWSRSSPATGLPGSGLVVGVPGPSTINPFTGTPRVNPLTAAAGPNTGIVYPPHVGVPAGVPLDKAGAPGATPVDYVCNPPGVNYRGTGAPLMQYPFNASSMQQRELIPIPVVDVEMGNMGNISAVTGSESNNGPHPPANKRRFDLIDEHNVNAINEPLPTKRKAPVNSRLGPRLPANIQSNCSLELRKVPRGLNTIAHLNNHFAKFGKIVNIQISYEGDPEAAIITFSTHAEANVAYRSTEAVLNNRFIKVFWHTEAAGSGETNTNTTINGARKNNHHYHLNNMTTNATAVNTVTQNETTVNKTTTTTEQPNKDNNSSNSSDGVTTANVEAATPTTGTPSTMAATHVPPMSLRLKNNMARPNPNNAGMRKKQEEQAKAVVLLANGLRRRKQELLQSYVKQMKSALELVERCDPQDTQRAKTLETVKVLQETIDKLRKEIAVEQGQMQAQMTTNQQQSPGNSNNMVPKKSKEQQKKELLDIELELFAQQQEGNDTTAIQKRLEELQRNLGILSASMAADQASSGGKIGNFSSSPRMHSRVIRNSVFPEGPTRVDRRPKTIVITGFAAEECDFVLGHFKHFGEISKHDVDREIPQLILSYATRMSAEQAVMRGKMFKGKKLQISWAPVINNTTIAGQKDVKQAIKEDNKQNVSQDVKVKEEASETMEEKPNSAVEDLTPLGRTNDKSDLLLSEKLMNDDALLPELRLEDEEEEEESEDRSWRR